MPMQDECPPVCPACGVPWRKHLGVSGTCAALQDAREEVARLTAENEELSRGGVHWWHAMRAVARVLGVAKLSDVLPAVEAIIATLPKTTNGAGDCYSTSEDAGAKDGADDEECCV